ncbi:MAG: hypothetical protein ABFR82_00430 [Nitrospirota bacterium]
MIKRFIFTIFSVCLVFAFTGCGGRGNDAPEGAKITFVPESITITDDGEPGWDRSRFKIIVKNGKDIPLSNVKLEIDFPFARSGTLTSDYLVQLFDDGSETDSPMEAKTGTDGTYTLIFDYLRGGLDYEGDVLATSGTASKTAKFTVAGGSSE